MFCVFCTTIIVKRKKARENDVTSGHVINVTSGHSTDVTSGHVTSVHVTSGDVLSGDVTSDSTPFPNYDGLQILKTVEVLIKPLTCGCRNIHSNDEKLYYILKTNNPLVFFWEPLYCNVFYVI